MCSAEQIMFLPLETTVSASKFFAALASDGAINEEALSVSELDRVYAPLRQQVTDSVHRQETVLARIQVSCQVHTHAHAHTHTHTQLVMHCPQAGVDGSCSTAESLDIHTPDYAVYTGRRQNW